MRQPILTENSIPLPLKHLAQATLAAQWTHRLPLFQSVAPAEHAAHLIAQVLANITDAGETPYTVIDICSGAGGPVPLIESTLNAKRAVAHQPPINFRLSDLRPPIDHWIDLSSHSAHLSFIPQSVDARQLPPAAISVSRRPPPHPESHLDRAGPHAHDEIAITGAISVQSHRRKERKRDASRETETLTADDKVVHLFCCAMHRFTDAELGQVLTQTLGKADAFVILELQDRSLGCLAMLLLEGIILMLVSWSWFPDDLPRLFLTYVFPAVPFMHSWDGVVGCLRTRTFAELRQSIDDILAEDQRLQEKRQLSNGFHSDDDQPDEDSCGLGDWTLSQAKIKHTRPCGWLHATIGIRKEIRRGMA